MKTLNDFSSTLTVPVALFRKSLQNPPRLKMRNPLLWNENKRINKISVYSHLRMCIVAQQTMHNPIFIAMIISQCDVAFPLAQVKVYLFPLSQYSILVLFDGIVGFANVFCRCILPRTRIRFGNFPPPPHTPQTPTTTFTVFDEYIRPKIDAHFMNGREHRCRRWMSRNIKLIDGISVRLPEDGSLSRSWIYSPLGFALLKQSRPHRTSHMVLIRADNTSTLNQHSLQTEKPTQLQALGTHIDAHVPASPVDNWATAYTNASSTGYNLINYEWNVKNAQMIWRELCKWNAHRKQFINYANGKVFERAIIVFIKWIFDIAVARLRGIQA